MKDVKSYWNHPVSVWMVRLVLSGVFLAACVPKIMDPPDFALSVFRYQLAPYGVVNLVAIFLPAIELCCAVALLAIPRLRDAALCVMGGMLALFTAAMLINLYRGIDIACGCFSVETSVGHLGWLNVVRNATLLLLCAWGLGQEWFGIMACRFGAGGIDRDALSDGKENHP